MKNLLVSIITVFLFCSHVTFSMEQPKENLTREQKLKLINFSRKNRSLKKLVKRLPVIFFIGNPKITFSDGSSVVPFVKSRM